MYDRKSRPEPQRKKQVRGARLGDLFEEVGFLVQAVDVSGFPNVWRHERQKIRGTSNLRDFVAETRLTWCFRKGHVFICVFVFLGDLGVRSWHHARTTLSVLASFWVKTRLAPPEPLGDTDKTSFFVTEGDVYHVMV
jgi:hypothetical protein